MDLGKRIKQARLDAGLSQRQLCGDVITRNMLSQIENCSAKPSMDTLGYLASQLGKPISYFLEETSASPNQAMMTAARSAFADKNFSAALDALEDYRTPDGIFDAEYHLLRALSFLQLAEQEPDPTKARQLLSQAADAGALTPYYTGDLERRRLLCLAQAAPDSCSLIADALPADDRELLLRGKAALENGDLSRCAALLDAANNRTSPDWLLLRADAAMALNDLELAGKYYHQAESAAPAKAYPKLEEYYLNREDYKMAYFYACKQR